jgi:MSHA biogenesis protein MshQ
MKCYQRAILLAGFLLLIGSRTFAANYTLPSASFPPCAGNWTSASNICSGQISFGNGDTVTSSSAQTLVANGGFALRGNSIGSASNPITLQSSYNQIATVTPHMATTIYGAVKNESAAIILTNVTINGLIDTASGAVTLTTSSVSGSVTGTGSGSLTSTDIGANVRFNNGLTVNGGTLSGTASSNSNASFTNANMVGAVSATNGLTASDTDFSSTISTNGKASLTGGSVMGALNANNGVTTNNTNLSDTITATNGTSSFTGGTINANINGNCCKITINGAYVTGNISSANAIEISNSSITGMVSNTNTIKFSNSTVYGNVTAASWSKISGEDSKVYGTCSPSATLPANLCDNVSIATCFTDNFDRSSLGNSDWAVTSSNGSFGVPKTVGNRLRLTDNTKKVATAATLQRLFPAAGNYVQVQFKHYAYNGSGADGIGIILSDATIAPQPGSFGGPLGYGTRGTASTPGFAGGWLGVGLDEYGNFSTEGGGANANGPGQRPESVAIRGSGAVSRTSGYSYIAGTAASLSQGVDASGSTPAPGYTYRISLDGRVSGKALLTVERDTGAGFTVLPGINAVDVLAASGQAALPQNFFLSFTGSSGGSTNTHELDDLQVCATELNPVGRQIDHFDFSYDSGALTCSPQPVTFKACLNESCSALLTDPVSVSLNPSSGWTATAPATVSGGNTISFSGGTATIQLRSNLVGDVAIEVAGSTPVTKPLSVPTCTSSGCKITYADSGFLLTIPNLLAAKPTAATIQAVKKSDTSQACIPGFTSGTRDVQFSASHLSPASGTEPVFVNGTPVSAALTDVNLSFDAAARAPLTVRYDDAGQVTLNARYAPTGGPENGLVMSGNDNFVAKPYGLCIQTDTSASCAANTGCPVFPGNVRAGDPFPMRVTAVAWQADGEALTAAALCSGNIATANFQLGSIALSSTVISPAGGSNGAPGVSSYSHVLGNQTTVSQTISEVGVFSLTATPANGSYLDGETVSGGTSGNVGRFIPAYLGANASASLTPSCGSAFSYQGQPMAFAVGQEPALTVTGYNRTGGVTTNYDRGAFWRLATPTRDAYVSVTGKASLDASGRLTSAGSASLSQSGADNGDGAQSYRWSGETLTYTPATLPLAADLPFTAAVSQGFSAAALTDADTACYLNGQASCQAYTYNFAASPGTAVRLGRLRIGNAHGSELQALSLPITLESWQSTAGGSFQPEGLDTCTNAAVLGAPLLSDFTGNLTTGKTTPSLVWPVVGSRSLLLSAPGAGNDGSVQATLTTLPTWLYFDWNGSGRSAAKGLASFGIYAGPEPLIFRRELYR